MNLNLNQRRAANKIAALAGAWILLAACRAERNADTSTAPAETARPTTPRTNTTTYLEGEPTSMLPARETWFADGIGRDAIIAMGRGDQSTALSLLHKLEAREDLSEDDRAGVDILLGLAEAQRNQYFAAATRFERASKAPKAAPIADELIVMAGEALLSANAASKAIELLSARPPSPEVAIVLARALASDKQPTQAIAALRAVVDQSQPEYQRKRVELALASQLADSTDDAQKAEASRRFAALLDQKLSGSETRIAKRALAALVPPSTTVEATKDKSATTVDNLLEQARDQLDARQYTSAIRTVDRLLKIAKNGPAATTCEANYLKGTAYFKLRRRADSRRPFQAALAACKTANLTDFAVKSGYQAARGIYAEGRYAVSAAAFKAVEEEFSSHSYADDALINGGEAWEMAGKPDNARAFYERVLSSYPTGDMRPEARRRLLILDFSNKQFEGAMRMIDDALAHDAQGEEAARLLYFRGRALVELGRMPEAIEAWQETLRRRPLSYPGLLATVRLREQGKLDAALALLRATDSVHGPSVDMRLPPTPEGQRVRAWSLLGAKAQTKRALDETNLDGWPAAYVLAQAGLWFESQGKIASMSSQWRQFPPEGDVRVLWELAHPVPFMDLLVPREIKYELPSLLGFAIMQTESRFDPSQVSIAGARGLLQLMPGTAQGTAKQLGMASTKNSDLHEPETNLTLGVSHLASLVSRFGTVPGAKALAIPSYNAGPGNVDKWLAQRGDWDLDLFIEAIPFDETRNYTQHVLGRWWAYRWLYSDDKLADRVIDLPQNAPAAGLAARKAYLASKRAAEPENDDGDKLQDDSVGG